MFPENTFSKISINGFVRTALIVSWMILLLVIPARASLSPGSLDTGFDPGTGAFGEVTSVAVQLDGKVILGGGFIEVDGVLRNNIARLNADGSLDISFDPGSGANDYVVVIAVQPNGKMIIGGWFTEVDGVARQLTRTVKD